MKPSNLEQQLLQVHRAVQNWEHCKSDLQAATRALTNASGLLRWCLDTWPPAPTASALQPPGFSLPGLTSSGGTCADELPGDGDGDGAPIGGRNPCVINQSKQPPLDGTNCSSVGGARQVPQPLTATSDVHDWGGAPKPQVGAQELLALVCQELAQAQYLHALALCAAGYGAAADPWIAGLGYRLRLSDEVWAACADSVDHLAGAHAAGPFDAAPWSSDITGGMDSLDVSLSKSGNPVTAATSFAPKPFSKAAKIATAVAAGEYDLSTESIAPKPGVARALEGGTVGLVSDPVPRAVPPLICDDVLPIALLYRLAAAFDPAGTTPYWRQHRYGERETPFFSYLHRLDQPTPSSASCSGVVEEAIQLLYRRLLRVGPHQPGEREGKGKAEEYGDLKMAPATAAAAARGAVASELHGVVVAEWWAHTRDPTSAHQLHFDLNEDVLRRGLEDYQLAHPVLSSVLFLPPASPAIRACRHPEAAAAAADAAVEATEAEPGPGAGSGGRSLELRPLSRWERRCCPGGPTLVLDQTPAGGRMRVELPVDRGCGRVTPSSLSVSSSSAPNTSAHAAAITPITDADAAAAPTGGRPPLARCAWAIGPRPNRLLLFPGDLLHGVIPQPVPTQPSLLRSNPPSPPPSAPEQYSAPPQKQPFEDRFLNKPPQPGQSDSRCKASGVAAVAAPRITLIVAWWGAERLRTATSAPPLVRPGCRGNLGPQLHVARCPGGGAGDEDGLAAVTVTMGEGGHGSTPGEGSAGQEDQKRRSAAVVSDAAGMLETVHKVERTGLEAAGKEEDVVERARVRRRLMLQLAGAKVPTNGVSNSGGDARVDDLGDHAAISTNTNTAPITSGGSGSESDGSSSGRSSSGSSGSTGETPTSSGSASRSSDVSIEDDDEDDNDDVDRENDNKDEEDDEEDEDPEQHQYGDGETSSMGRVIRHRPYVLDWSHAGALRSGMLLPPLTTQDGLLPPIHERSSRPQSLDSESQQPGKVSGITPPGITLAESPERGNDRSGCISGVTRTPPGGSPPLTNRLSWRHWFAALRTRTSLVSANRMGVSGMESGEDGGTLAPLQWRMPLCISPAWVPVKRPPRDLRCAANSGAAATTSSAASVDAAVPAAAAAVDDSEFWGPAKVVAKEGSSKGVEPTEGDSQLLSSAPTPMWNSDWELGQQAVRGMAVALGLAPAMRTVKRHRRQQQASEIKQSDGAEGREEKREEEEEEQEEGDSGEEEEQPGVSGLRCVMASLGLPGLRVFLRHPRELEHLYLPPAPSSGIDSRTHQEKPE